MRLALHAFRGIIVLSMEHVAQSWLSQPKVPPTNDLAPPRLILDASQNRFQLTGASIPSAAVGVADLPRTTVRTMHSHEIKSLSSMRSMIESAALDMHAQYSASQAAQPLAADASAAVPPATPSNPYALEEDEPESVSCDTVTLFIDDLMSLFARFGPSAVLPWLNTLKSSRANLGIIAGVDLDGITTLGTTMDGTNNGTMAPTSVRAHLSHLATTTVSILSMHPLPSSSSAAFAINVHIVHKRPSGKVTNVSESLEVRARDGVVKKLPVSHLDAPPPNSSASTAASTAASTGSLAQQFGSSFSLDLTSTAKSARAKAVLPYAHMANVGAVASLDVQDDDDLLDEDEDEDFDDPDDDLEI